jgi:hypothetical protein
LRAVVQVAFRERGVYHLRYSDANGNGQPDPGEISTEFERGRVFCP